jgi:L,D-transpeptidase ErfK/SrfK
MRLVACVIALILLSPAPAQDLVGQPWTYEAKDSDTLLDVARLFDVGYVAIRAANPAIDPWLPGAGRQIMVPAWHILPAAPRRGIVINLAELRLYHFVREGVVRSYPIGIGGEGAETPLGQTIIAGKRPNPTWYPTKSEREEDPDLPEVVRPGPDNPMGDFALYLGWSGYAMHGTNKPFSIGRRDSHGCIRLYPEDIAVLYQETAVGTPVTVVDQPVKFGWQGAELYAEIHPTQQDADLVEQGLALTPEAAPDADDEVVRAAGWAADRIDWYAFHLAELRRDGMPVRVTRPDLSASLPD